jgi:aldehyde:ferredoxin oxidoreductase
VKKPGASKAHYLPSIPVFDGMKWDWKDCGDLYLDHDGVEQWKTAFYTFEGWDSRTGYRTRRTLEMLGLSRVANVLEKSGKLGV